MDNLLFIDAETNGLYGGVISVAMIAIDKNGNEMERVYYGISTENLLINDEWVKENVIPFVGNYEQCSDEDELLENVWEFWDKYRNNSMMVGDVIFPVESNILRRCVEFDVKNRKFDGPYPLLDISSMLYAIGINPNEKREELINLSDFSNNSEGRIHNALYDVEIMIEIWKKYFMKGY